MLAPAPEGGEIDLLDWFAELTIYTSSTCLIGPLICRGSKVVPWRAVRPPELARYNG